jgi:hypothetical protein
LREIAGQWGFSKSSLERHKSHVSVAIERTQEKREERLGDNLHDEMKRVLDGAWVLTDKAEKAGDHRGAIVALHEVREALESLNGLVVPAGSGPNGARLEVTVTFIGAK